MPFFSFAATAGSRSLTRSSTSSTTAVSNVSLQHVYSRPSISCFAAGIRPTSLTLSPFITSISKGSLFFFTILRCGLLIRLKGPARCRKWLKKKKKNFHTLRARARAAAMGFVENVFQFPAVQTSSFHLLLNAYVICLLSVSSSSVSFSLLSFSL